MLQIKINPSDLKNLNNKVRLIPLALQDSSFLSSTGMALSAQAKQNIHQGSPDGKSSYLLLKPSTIHQKQQQKYSTQPLVRTGNLKNSIGFETSAGHLYLTALNYAKYHQFGSKKMEARPIFSIREENQTFILTKLTQTIVKLLR